MSQPPGLIEAMLNLSRYHQQHEKFYAQTPLQQAIAMQQASRVLKTFADRWDKTEPQEARQGNPFLGCEDLNKPADMQSSGVLFMEGQGEPPEIARLKRDLTTLSDDFQETVDGWRKPCRRPGRSPGALWNTRPWPESSANVTAS